MKVSKKIMISLISILFISFSGCDSSKMEDESLSAEGERTTFNLKLNFSSITTPGTKSFLKSTGDPNATEAEAKVGTVDVFIYGESGYYISHTSLSVADFTQVEGSGTSDKYQYASTTKIPATTGPKKIFVAVNLPSGVAAALEDKPSNELTQVAQTLAANQLVAADGSIVMTSTELLTYEFVKNGAANNPTISVERMVAKVTAQKAADMVQAGVPGTLFDMRFAINNFNSKSYFIQGAAPDFKDPNWDVYTASDFSEATANDYIRVNEPDVTDPRNLNALYAAENTSQYHRVKEITRAQVRAGFLPASVVIYGNGNYIEVTSASQGKTAPQTFYTIILSRPEPQIYCFFDRTTAENYAVANGKTAADIVTYTDGLCYWDMYLNKNVWDVLRNDYYKCTVTRILVPGRPTDDPKDPDSPPASDVDITINVEVVYWNDPVLGNYELEP
ncbi:Mfa1 family fimbria major subunit [Dysgonomonas sp. GY75]|uniref:Mfa1 family fimbria major subunit n=1 Tax=Dysgonomonas sp. GY75 TaxID=2780419 RepID=UPI0018841035|nr:Mfa1 family fimbria major subunit [Dysgonomonas sp. GY75]MBF0647210.1 Mfa1 family fimbria major subunit [Dysgonomonas sp. GY75]